MATNKNKEPSILDFSQAPPTKSLQDALADGGIGLSRLFNNVYPLEETSNAVAATISDKTKKVLAQQAEAILEKIREGNKNHPLCQVDKNLNIHLEKWFASGLDTSVQKNIEKFIQTICMYASTTIFNENGGYTDAITTYFNTHFKNENTPDPIKYAIQQVGREDFHHGLFASASIYLSEKLLTSSADPYTNAVLSAISNNINSSKISDIYLDHKLARTKTLSKATQPATSKPNPHTLWQPAKPTNKSEIQIGRHKPNKPSS